MKATEGINHKDKNFEKNYHLATKHNIRIGFYHFYRFDYSPVDQAKFYLSTIDEKKYQMPLVIDVEEWGNEISKTRKELRKEISLFIEYIEAQTNCKMIVYTNSSSYESYIKGLENEIWLCSFRKEKKLEGNWLFWQYSHKGKLPYVEGWVDFNTFNGTKEEFQSYLDNYCKN